MKSVVFAVGLCAALGGDTVAAQETETPTAVFNQPVGISPDSSRVFFQSWAPQQNGAYRSQLFSIDLEGETARREMRIGYNAGWPAFTRDGMKAVLHTRIGRDAELLLLDLKEPGNLTEFLSVKRLTVGTDADFFAAWSPDETEIAFYSWRTDKAQIYVMNADGSNVRNLTADEHNHSDPSWSVKGEVTYESHASGNPEVWVMSGDGSNKRNLTNHPAEDHFGDWSPDGEFIVFSSNRDGSEDLYIMRRDGSEVRQLTNAPETDHWPRWSKDGTFITFERRTDAGGDVYIIAPDGSGEKRLTNGASYQEK